MKKANTSQSIVRLTLTAIFTALILLMTVTPLGYLKTAGLEITFLMLPVAFGAMTVGPKAGAFLGGIWGLTSFAQCYGILGASAFGAALRSINPWLTFIVCFVPRVLVGLLTGLIFRAVAKVDKRGVLCFGVGSIAAAVLNTVLFMTALCLCFYHTAFIQNMANQLHASNVIMFIVLFVGINGLVEAAACVFISFPVSKLLSTVVKRITQ